MCFLENHKPKAEHLDQRIVLLKNMISKYCGTSIKIIIGIDVFISKVCFNITYDASHMGQQTVLALLERIHFSQALCVLTFP